MNFKLILVGLLLSAGLYSCSGAKKAAHNKAVGTKVVNNNKNGTAGGSEQERKTIVRYARTFIGVPYRYGGNTPKEGFDCSGYVKYVYNKFNVNVPRVTRDYVNYGKRISLYKIRPGDLILFSLYDDKSKIGHIGIVSDVEKDKVMFLHAASGKTSGKVMESELSGIHLSRMLFITRVLD
ncbi:MAG: C40 family peptidase [Taibaiella sp.]|nr:C40 family peptidase [Taibaiella sp.]